MTDNEHNRCRNIMALMEKQHEKDIRALERQIADLERLMDSKFDARRQAVETAQAAIDARFESVNEFRATLSDQTKSFVTRAVMDAIVNELGRRVGELENRVAVYDGRIIGWSAGSAFIVLIIAVVMRLVGV